MNQTAREGSDPNRTASPAFSAPYERDGVSVITATSTGGPVRSMSGAIRPGPNAVSGSHPMGAFVITSGAARWHPAVDVTRLLTTAEAVVGAVLVARILARRPGGPQAQVTMGPGGWVSLKGGALKVRPVRPPWGRSPQRPQLEGNQKAPLWARLLSAVPLQSLDNPERKHKRLTR